VIAKKKLLLKVRSQKLVRKLRTILVKKIRFVLCSNFSLKLLSVKGIGVRDQLTVSHICTMIYTPIEKFGGHVFKHQRTVLLRTTIEVLKSKILSLNTEEMKS
jgi:hypothetical protein